MISVVLKKGVEEPPQAIARNARSIKSLGYREITVTSDTEPSILAFRNLVGVLARECWSLLNIC